MYFKTTAECEDLARFFGFRAEPKVNELAKHSGPSPNQLRADMQGVQVNPFILSQRIVSWLGQSGPRLLWVTEAGIWPSIENRHLYYRLRGSYHDYRSIGDAPGHFFENYEVPDLITFLELVIRFGWGGFLFGPPTCHLTISHDQWFVVGSDLSLNDMAKDLDDLRVPYEANGR